MPNGYDYDLVVLGSGPAGQKGAICAAKLHKRVAIVENRWALGGVCVHSGTIPSKTLREAVLYLSGFREKTFYGRSYQVKDRVVMADLTFRVDAVIKRETEVIRAQLQRNQVVPLDGYGRFVDAHTVEVESAEGTRRVTSENFLVSTGTRPASDQHYQLDGTHIFNSDQLLSLSEVPRELIVVGAGVIGLEYASMIAALGVKITILDARPTILDFIDREIMDSLQFQLRQLNVIFRLGEKVTTCVYDAERGRVIATLESGKRVHGDGLLFTVGRQANTDKLNLESAGLKTGDRGKLEVNEQFQTAVPNIYAAGDVIGFPALASTSMEQGRIASCNMFGVPSKMRPQFFPYGIYTIPEISIVGQTEEQLTHDKVPYEVGIARYSELAKGQMLGDEHGLLKLLFHSESLKLLGVHIIGERAAEIIHIGQAVLSFGGSIEYFRDTVFNYPTMAEAYKVAALDGLNKL
ncbi:pyridine nucleotide-disulfide oxidoreductase [Candidatus Koribacter versatilis Ellin345]|uniref:Soluble pyridine nucleotide transhydrogenase n=1 Tax=Koribacter versatilis (strain Ellin345) TaxID=204669 RepID=Q1ILM6_KORVE|nr:Si-specific NAD(P)(+) transhydrogenase [Candidatus Koribacter versatilis]ABF42224.1 pyridine nucleotide-disulfide oxidoreductase [Candidatus Koribacter versatilis Ellin345]